MVWWTQSHVWLSLRAASNGPKAAAGEGTSSEAGNAAGSWQCSSSLCPSEGLLGTVPLLHLQPLSLAPLLYVLYDLCGERWVETVCFLGACAALLSVTEMEIYLCMFL